MTIDLAPFGTTEGLVALATLTALEIVLGIDNIVFISVLTGKLPPERRRAARRAGLAVALVSRLLLLLTLRQIRRLGMQPLFPLPMNPVLHETLRDGTRAPLGISGKDLILFCGGLFLIAKATLEIH